MNINELILKEKSVSNIRKFVIEVSNCIADLQDKNEIINKLKYIIKIVGEMQYDNCSVSDYEALIDEEVVLDILLNKGNLDRETAREIVYNKQKYLNGEYTPKKVLSGILGEI
ncbi:hypothetical protein M4I33_02895 [Clostridium sp. LY3-2]|uniref:hypothetical protein n=1 Tax=Clostridium sp. LY3-2 TaxID=2942482 RepID=UPI002152609C|nr:hypothetical protein [Clostridium sp. LY3-2]MCR6513828.1 hypothetical protein [Clostridium sp. LY3-2]